MTLAADAHKLLVMTAQVVLSALFIAGYFYLVIQFLQGKVHVPENYKDMFMTLLGVLTAGVMLILNFWFSRTRPTAANP